MKTSSIYTSVSVSGLLAFSCFDPVFAGGFAVREQSAYGQGSSFAGIAAPGDSLSAMFWNPASITRFDGLTFEGIASGIFPFTDSNIEPSLTAIGGGLGGRGATSNVGVAALVPATYAAYQLSDKIYLGLSVNSPFGLSTDSDDGRLEEFASQEFAALSINASPTVAYKVNEMLSIGAGVQIQYFDVDQSRLLTPASPGSRVELEADAFSFGFNLGATITPREGTTIGVGYRSGMDVNLEGRATGNLLLGAPAPFTSPNVISTNVNADLALPDIFTIGLRQSIGEQFTLLAGFGWENWSGLGSVDIVSPTLGTLTSFEFNFEDSYYYALGGEYEFNDALTLRAGVSYETSPTNDEDRSLALPDNDRLWLSTGATYKASEKLSIDLGYSYILVDNDTPVSADFASGSELYSGTADSDLHIFSVGGRVQF